MGYALGIYGRINARGALLDHKSSQSRHEGVVAGHYQVFYIGGKSFHLRKDITFL
jgi:hypothetical protein